MFGRLAWLMVALAIVVLNANALRPVVFLTKDVKSCCLNCKQHACPSKKPAESMPSCHMAQPGGQSTKMKSSCNHSNDLAFFYYEAILISSKFVAEYSAENRFAGYASMTNFQSFSPLVPPPRIL